MKKIFLILTFFVVSSVFANGPTKTEVSSQVSRVESLQENHTKNISDMETALQDTSNNVEYRDILSRLSNKGAAMTWQKHLFEQAGNRADKEKYLAEYKKLDGEYQELISKLKSFGGKL
jgi:hypothetical protein